MGIRSKSWCLLAVLYLFSGVAQAAPKSTGMGYFFSAGVGASYGTLAASNLGLDSRSLAVYGVSGDLGITLKSLMLGAGIDYNLWKQLKNPSDLNGTNAQGNELSWGPAVGYDFGKFVLLGHYYLSSKYKLDKTDTSGNAVAFSKPKSSFAVECRIPFGNGKPYLGLKYKHMKYSNADVGSTSNDIPSGSEVSASSFGVSLGLAF